MPYRRLHRAGLAGRVIDVHSHAGVSLKTYACQEYPYAATIEGLAAHQRAAGVDVNVVFPFSADLFFDPVALVRRGACRPARRPFSPAPYATENELLLREVFEFCPETQHRFLPFVSVDPGRKPAEQVRLLTDLASRYPIYGIKINPVICQSRITHLLGRGRPLLDLARAHRWPLLLHTTPQPNESYSNADLTFRVIERNPDLRFCLAHAIGFHRDYLRRAADLPNVWVDTAALKIQVQCAHEGNPLMPAAGDRLDTDYSDHRRVMRALAERYPDRILWGTDAPAYAYICRRLQAKGVYAEFRLKARYEDEVAALRALPPRLQRKVAGANTLDFIFGQA